ncbi:FAD-binding oxidoreductase [Salinisphaera sp.]|uniref:FAD-binding oxidoreductase n=1 Tax=Salinisphaera sp. TaxID=1914330 RepID=UPI000C462083|nr:FAD-binding oxidoreductase [Salinisphaera sp.]MBS63113.1 oxidoreductase [Salinisphaera sp.]
MDAGIDYPQGRRSGRCEACKPRLIPGDVALLEHTKFAPSPEERTNGLILACRAQRQADACVAWLGGDDESAEHPRQTLRCRVAQLEDATRDIKSVVLEVVDGPPLAYSAGQYVRVTFPEAPTRDYSMAACPNSGVLEFHVRRTSGGATSQRVAMALSLGDEVTVDGPYGASFLREKYAGPIVVIAGGSGLTPIKSIVDTALVRGLRQPIHVYHGVRTPRDMYFKAHFEAFGERYANVTLTPVLSEASGMYGWRTSWVTDAIGEDLNDLDGWKAYVAGPPAMVDAAQDTLTQRGLNADMLFMPESEAAVRA